MDEKNSMVELFAPFLEEVKNIYGEKIAEICRRKLLLINSVEKVDEMAILAEAKKEAGFDPKLSSLANAEHYFVT